MTEHTDRIVDEMVDGFRSVMDDDISDEVVRDVTSISLMSTVRLLRAADRDGIGPYLMAGELLETSVKLMALDAPESTLPMLAELTDTAHAFKRMA